MMSLGVIGVGHIGKLVAKNVNFRYEFYGYDTNGIPDVFVKKQE